jgi:4-amino-4-deoxy-L-arabinose transferase-like glycosyltransferase
MMIPVVVLNGVLFLSVAIALFLKYRARRDRGFLWLGISLVLFPLLGAPLAGILHHAMNRVSAGETIGLFPFTLVESGRITLGEFVALLSHLRGAIWSAFVLLGVLMLCRARPSSDA